MSKLYIIVLLAGLGGCSLLAGGSVVDSALVVHTAGSSQSTIAARLPIEASKVYAAFAAVVEEHPEIKIDSKKDSAMMIEVTGGFGKIVAQVTTLGARESLLYVWADASGTGRLGSEVATNAVEAVCEKLGVAYDRVEK
jgi:hypothetical protein